VLVVRVVVTGASGFVGRQAVTALRALGHSVISVGRGYPASDDAHRIKVDLLAPGAAQGLAKMIDADALLHLAWTTRHGQYWNDLSNLEWLSVTAELVTAFGRRGVRRVCVVGSCFEYDWPEDGDCREEFTATSSHTLYDAAKSSCRRVLDQIADRLALSFAWGRLFYLYGPGEHPDRLVASVCRSVLAGESARCSSGKAVRDFMDVRDAGAALAHLTVSNLRGVINIASGEQASIEYVAKTIGELASRPDLISLGAIPDRTDDPPRITADVTRLRCELGFDVRPLRRGLEDALRYWSDKRGL
jgi:nucleoside-diphosphate-sugar epimerase